MATTNDLARRLARLERAALRTHRTQSQRDMTLTPDDTRKMLATLIDAGCALHDDALGAQLRRLIDIGMARQQAQEAIA